MLQVREQTDEQIQNDKTRQSELHNSIKGDLLGGNIQNEILKDLGLSPEPESKQKNKPEVKEESPKEEPVEEEELQEESEEESQEEESEEDEEVIPKSKVQKRFDELTAKLKAQQRELDDLRSSKSEPKDEISKQLESMTSEQLKAAKLEVRKAQIKAQDDDSRLNELLELEDKIDTAMQDAPKNFANAQVVAFNKAARDIAESGDIKDMEKASPEILKIAKEIYDEHSSLQKDINGQATALKLAVKHYKALNSVPGDKTKETELKRQNNNLKRKVTLDTKVGKVNADKSKMDSLVKNAIGGTMSQKVSLVKSHPMFNVDKMIPDEFK